MSYPILVGQYVGLLDIADSNDGIKKVAAIRSGLGLGQFEARTASLLTALDHGNRHEVNDIYPEASRDLEDLIGSGLALDANFPDTIDPEKVRLVPRGVSMGLDEESLDFRLQGSASVLVPELVFWAWVYGSTCSSLRQTGELVSALHPDADAATVVDLVKDHLVRMHQSGCIALDAALTTD